MRRLALIGVLAGGLAAVPAAHAARPCGPAGAETLARGAEARVYVSRGRVVGCHRAARRTTRLGARGAALDAWVAGRYTAVRTRRRGRAGGERLFLRDLRDGRLVVNGDFPVFKRVREVRLDPVGTAAYLAVLPATELQPERTVVGVTDESDGEVLDSGPGVHGHALGFAGSVVAWRRGPEIAFATVSTNAVADPAPGALLRAGDLRLTARSRVVSVRRAGRAPIRLGKAKGLCVSASGCAGIAAVQRAGRFVAVLDRSSNYSRFSSSLRVIDVEDRTDRTAYSTPDGTDSAIVSFVLAESGATAFGVTEDDDGPAVNRIRTGDGRLLDEGALDPASLHRRGDRVVWRGTDGTERSAPLERSDGT